MTIIKPDYYNKFSCIAHKCRHNCCIGWEIDIDEDTLRNYDGVTGEFSLRLKENISLEGTPHFTLCENERCPFLNERNLCDIITNLGEEYLCEICAEHPRFYNVYSTFTEVGLGLSCEEAARIIITDEDAFSLMCDDIPDYDGLTESEKDLLEIREGIFGELTRKDISLGDRIKNITSRMDIYCEDVPSYPWAEEFSRLEILDEGWKEYLLLLSSYDESMSIPMDEYEKAFENLLCCFVYRHLHGALYDGCLNERLMFAVVSVMVIYRIFAVKYTKHRAGIDELIETARIYSAETEYSEENTEELLNILFGIV